MLFIEEKAFLQTRLSQKAFFRQPSKAFKCFLVLPEKCYFSRGLFPRPSGNVFSCAECPARPVKSGISCASWPGV